VKKHGGKANGKGGKGGFRGGKGAPQGGGQWMFVPASPFFGGAPQRSFGKGGQKFGKGGQRFGKGGQSFGKGFGGAFGGKGGGKHANQNPQQKKSLDKLGKIESELKVWIGGLSKEVNRGKLCAHFKETCKPHIFEIMNKGSACMSFKTAEEAQLAIDTFNGSELDGKEIQVDVWTKKEKKERSEGEQPRKTTSVIKTSFLKGKKGNKGNKPGASPIALKIKAVEHTMKVWVGGLSQKTTWKELKQHFVDNGCEVDMCDLMKPGTACCTFKSEDEATGAVGTMNGTELADNTIEVDVWTKPERREKKTKAVKEEA